MKEARTTLASMRARRHALPPAAALLCACAGGDGEPVYVFRMHGLRPSMVEADLAYWIRTVQSFCPWGGCVHAEE